MNIACEEYDDVAVITIDGEFSADTVEVFKNTIEENFQNKRVFFVINFEKVSLIDSQGLETLLWLVDQCEERQGQVKLAALDETSAQILAITKVDQTFDIHPQVIEAVKCFS